MYEEKRIHSRRIQRKAFAVALMGAFLSLGVGLVGMSEPIRSVVEKALGLTISTTTALLIAIVPMFVSVAFLMKEQLFATFLRFDVGEARIERQRRLLEDKLQQLEALRQADLQTLIKTKK